MERKSSQWPVSLKHLDDSAGHYFSTYVEKFQTKREMKAIS